MKRGFIIIAAGAMMLMSCGGASTKDTANKKDSVQTALNQGDRSLDSVQNHGPVPMIQQQTMGKVVAERYADLAFEIALPIERVLVKNGQHVRQGQVLAQLDQFKLRTAIAQQEQAIEQAQLQIEQAYLQMQDVIIAQGYDPDKKDQVPANVMHNADMKSGYALSKSKLASAKTQLAAARHELRSGVLTAPFDGVIANVSVQAHQLAQAGQTVCRVIASGKMNVEFRVMEADLAKYKLGTAVAVIPVADRSHTYNATVSEINPVVDEQGAVTLRAQLASGTTLFDGMNVEVLTIDK